VLIRLHYWWKWLTEKARLEICQAATETETEITRKKHRQPKEAKKRREDGKCGFVCPRCHKARRYSRAQVRKQPLRANAFIVIGILTHKCHIGKYLPSVGWSF
jgi:hypothetical protein